MAIADVVKVTQYLTRAGDAYAKVRARSLGDTEPASMLLVIPRPDFLVEVEIVAAAEAQ